jgi:NitT/TauT family transport system substrate-binding protein
LIEISKQPYSSFVIEGEAKMKAIHKLVTLLVLVALLAACAPQTVVETVTVIQTVEVAGTPVVQEKVITTTPLPAVDTPTPIPPMDKVTLRLNWSFYGIHAAFIYGVEQGIYADHNIDLTVKQGNGSGNAVKLVANKDSDFGYGSNGALISNANGGAPVIAVASIDASGTDAVLCRPDSGITSFTDLKGKTIMTTAGAGVNNYFPVALANQGMTEADVKLTNVAESALVTSYLQNLAPCILAGIDDKPAQIEAEGGDPPVIFNYADYGVAQPGYVIVANTDMVNDNPDLVQRMVSATLESVEACLNDREGCTQALVDYNSQLADTEDMVRKQLDVSLDIVYSPNNTEQCLGWNVPADWESVIELQKTYLALETNMTADEFYTNQFVPCAPK